jgi:hypothetical protein
VRESLNAFQPKLKKVPIMKPEANDPDTTQLDLWTPDSPPPTASVPALAANAPANSEMTPIDRSPPKRTRDRKKRRPAMSADEASGGRLGARACPGQPDRLDIVVDYRTGQQLRALAHRLGVSKRTLVRRLLRMALELTGSESLTEDRK